MGAKCCGAAATKESVSEIINESTKPDIMDIIFGEFADLFDSQVITPWMKWRRAKQPAPSDEDDTDFAAALKLVKEREAFRDAQREAGEDTAAIYFTLYQGPGDVPRTESKWMVDKLGDGDGDEYARNLLNISTEYCVRERAEEVFNRPSVRGPIVELLQRHYKCGAPSADPNSSGKVIDLAKEVVRDLIHGVAKSMAKDARN